MLKTYNFKTIGPFQNLQLTFYFMGTAFNGHSDDVKVRCDIRRCLVRLMELCGGNRTVWGAA